MQPDILFVGAGPVGLFTAINAKLLNPKQEILLLERNEKYSRNHILIVDKKSYKGSHPHTGFQVILSKMHGPVPTVDIEEKFRNFALKLGIKIEHKQVIDGYGLIPMIIDPTRAPFKSVAGLLKGKDAVILYNNELYYTDQRNKIVLKIERTESNGDDFDKLQSRFTDSYKLADIDEFSLISSLIGHAIVDVNKLAETYPSAHTIVGADGANSLIRRKIFNDEKVVDETLQYIIEVKYKSSKPIKKLSFINTLEGLSQISHFVSEHVGKAKNGQTPVSLFFFVDKKTYDEVRAKGTSINLTDIAAGSKEMTSLANSIHPWLALRRYHKQDIPITDSVKIAAVALQDYKSKNCVKVVNEKRYVLVGDAKLGIPYFRALNAGYIGGIKGAELISQPERDNSYKNAKFDNDMSALASKEIADAHKKNIKVKVGKGFAGFLRFGSLKVSHDFMAPEAKKIMRNARVTPLPFFKRHRVFFSCLLLFILLAAILSATGAFPIGVGLSILVSAGITMLLLSAYRGLSAFVGYLRCKPDAPIIKEQLFLDSEPGSALASAPVLDKGDSVIDSVNDTNNKFSEEAPDLQSYPHPAGLSFNSGERAEDQGFDETVIEEPENIQFSMVHQN